MNKITILVALVAGMTGSLITRYISPSTVFAQNQTPVPHEVRAQNLTLVGLGGAVAATATFSAERTSQRPFLRVVVRDITGMEIWSTPVEASNICKYASCENGTPSGGKSK